MKRLAGIATICVAFISLFSSCTYDYFEDEMNYKIYVPEFREKSIKDCSILLWNIDDNSLAGEWYSKTSAPQDALIRDGLFYFRLRPGNYKAHIIANLDSVNIFERTSFQDATFAFDANNQKVRLAPYPFKNDYVEREIKAIGQQIVDTAHISRYPAQLIVHYHGAGLNPSLCKSIRMTLKNVSTVHNISVGSPDLSMEEVEHNYEFTDLVPFPSDADGAMFSVGGFLFPTHPEQVVQLSLSYNDEKGEPILAYNFQLMDSSNPGHPLKFGRGEDVIIDIYGSSEDGFFFRVKGWDPDIKGSLLDINGSGDPKDNDKTKSRK